MAEMPETFSIGTAELELVGSTPSNAQIALMASAATFSSSISRHDTRAVLTTAETFKKWLDDQDAKDASGS